MSREPERSSASLTVSARDLVSAASIASLHLSRCVRKLAMCGLPLTSVASCAASSLDLARMSVIFFAISSWDLRSPSKT